MEESAHLWVREKEENTPEPIFWKAKEKSRNFYSRKKKIFTHKKYTQATRRETADHSLNECQRIKKQEHSLNIKNSSIKKKE